MFKSLKRVSYQVRDIEKAKEWYSSIFEIEPIYSSPLVVVFKINDSEVTLFPADQEINHGSAQTIYWEVEDVDALYSELIKQGAAPSVEPRTLMTSRTAQVTDPFGNVIGLTGKISEKKKTLDDQPSDSAMTTAFCRAVSNADDRDEIRGSDYLARIFLHEESKRPLKDKAAREWTLKNILQGGAYEYFVARTAYIDKIFLDALQTEIPQIVFLGAGYDSRVYRFADKIKNTKIFELDSLPTQTRKRKLLNEAGIKIPQQLEYIPINFDSESLEEKLTASGYRKDVQSLFIWEGVTYYLDNEPVFSTLKFIKDNSAPGSKLFFDYMLYSEERHSRPDIKDALDRMRSTYRAEGVKFMVEENKIYELLEACNYKLLEEMHTAEMEKKYLTLKDGTLSGRIIDLFSFVLAET